MKKICVIGGANIDVCGASIVPLKDYDSNPGEISICYGGVGRNIAQICAMLNRNPLFVSCFSTDSYGKQMEADCRYLGIDTSLSKWVSDVPSSMYIAILDESHDMKIGMSDMRILEYIDYEMIDRVLHHLSKDDLLVVDANLSHEILTYIAEHSPCKIAADAVSANKVLRLKPFLNRIAIFKPNQYEAKELNGISIYDDKTAVESVKWFLNQGVEEVMISLADRGLVFGTKEKISWFTHRKLQLSNATGGGDTFIGAYLSMRLYEGAHCETVKYALTAAAMAIEQDAVRKRVLTDTLVCSRIEDLNIKERIL